MTVRPSSICEPTDRSGASDGIDAIHGVRHPGKLPDRMNSAAAVPARWANWSSDPWINFLPSR